MIEWVYEYNNNVVDKDEELWSSTMKCWVPIDEPALLISISITDRTYLWLNSKGLFHACADDNYGYSWSSHRYRINLRKLRG